MKICFIIFGLLCALGVGVVSAQTDFEIYEEKYHGRVHTTKKLKQKIVNCERQKNVGATHTIRKYAYSNCLGTLGGKFLRQRDEWLKKAYKQLTPMTRERIRKYKYYGKPCHKQAWSYDALVCMHKATEEAFKLDMEDAFGNGTNRTKVKGHLTEADTKLALKAIKNAYMLDVAWGVSQKRCKDELWRIDHKGSSTRKALGYPEKPKSKFKVHCQKYKHFPGHAKTRFVGYKKTVVADKKRRKIKPLPRPRSRPVGIYKVIEIYHPTTRVHK